MESRSKVEYSENDRLLYSTHITCRYEAFSNSTRSALPPAAILVGLAPFILPVLSLAIDSTGAEAHFVELHS